MRPAQSDVTHSPLKLNQAGNGLSGQRFSCVRRNAGYLQPYGRQGSKPLRNLLIMQLFILPILWQWIVGQICAEPWEVCSAGAD